MHNPHHERAWFFLVALILLSGVVWYAVLFKAPARAAELYFLDVGQGDGALVILEGGVKILFDAGPGRALSESLAAIKRDVSFIDLVFISHPQRDHFGGLIPLLDEVKIGALLITGRPAEGESEDGWQRIIDNARARNVPIITIAQGSSIQYRGNIISILSPDADVIQSGDLNDTSLVAKLQTEHWSALFTGDIGKSAEEHLLPLLTRVDILKVPHHGSKYSSGDIFLDRILPRIAVVQVGENRFGHPSDETLARFETRGIPVFRNDTHGTVHLREQNGKLSVFTER